MLARATRAVARNAHQTRAFMALAEDHDQIRDVARGFAEERLMPIAGETDRLHKFPREAVTELATARAFPQSSARYVLGSDADNAASIRETLEKPEGKALCRLLTRTKATRSGC